MAQTPMDRAELDRRHFLKSAGAGMTAAALVLTPGEAAAAQEQARKAALDRLASNSWPLRHSRIGRFLCFATTALCRSALRANFVSGEWMNAWWSAPSIVGARNWSGHTSSMCVRA